MVVRNELGRYLRPAVEALLGFCDEVRILDDSSDDGSTGWAAEQWTKGPVFAAITDEPSFFKHEGSVRQLALDWALKGEPTHVLAIDADEFVADGDLLRRMVEDYPEASAFSLCMTEVWRARLDGFDVRCDGRWRPHRAPILWKIPGDVAPRIPDSPAASGRIPTNVISDVVHTDIEIFHFGWAREADRERRHARYANAGSFGHDPNHIASILWSDARVGTETRRWPDEMDPAVIEEIVAASSPVTA